MTHLRHETINHNNILYMRLNRLSYGPYEYISAMTSVTVYIPINTTIDPSGVEVFGETVTTSDRIINCQVTIDVANILPVFRYQEDPTNRDNVVVTTIPSNDAGFVSDLSGTLNGFSDLDLSSYSWWPSLSSAPYYGNSVNAMYHYRSVYEVLLSQIAYDLFGHPLAKAGIANDMNILSYFHEQNLARMLVNDLESLSSSALRVVYQQMVKQAPSRFNNQDSAAGTAGINGPLPVALPFQEGDTIRFEVTLAGYNVTPFGTSVDTATPGYSVAKNKGLISTSNGPVTYTLNVNIGAAPMYPGSQSFIFDGDSYLSLATNSNLPLGNTAYTVEAWIKTNSFGGGSYGNYGIVGWGNYFIPYAANGFRLFSPGLQHYWWNQDLTSSAPNIIDGAWHHVVAQHDGLNRSIYVDGVLIGADAVSTHSVTQYDNLTIGTTKGYTNNVYVGKITNVRIVKGVAVYTGNFTVPTSPLTATQEAGININAITAGQTALLLNVSESNPYGDSSSYGYTMTLNGTPRISSDSPFTL